MKAHLRTACLRALVLASGRQVVQNGSLLKSMRALATSVWLRHWKEGQGAVHANGFPLDSYVVVVVVSGAILPITIGGCHVRLAIGQEPS